ncbi:hypothetical protein [Streptomyces sp. AC555_RSS877]|uniref:hypothetical protein n=1 Tax=Streptomyces sp. AC555_RSS877 TaxID=2823688 RepID=UPI001C26DCFF|nr:hypothetical protein [Streptomyces sp. AC555_RSS877]
MTQPEPIRKSLLPCTPPPEWEFHTVLGARSDTSGVALFPGDTGPVVIRRRVSYGDWEPVRPGCWAEEPPTDAAAVPAGVAPAPDQTAPELTAEEARDLVDELGLQLYRSEDALAFVEECCVIADREQRPVTTAMVREWLKGARCGRQLLADAEDRAAFESALASQTGPKADSKPATDRADAAERRERYATPLFAIMRQNGWDGEHTEQVDREMDLVLDAVLAVADAEQAELRRERDLAIAHDRQPYPTAWAYEQACKALHRKEAAIERVLEFAASLDEIGRRLAGPDAVHPVAARIRHLLDTQPVGGAQQPKEA